MFNTHEVEINWGGRPLKLSTGKIARQADGAVMVQYGETTVLATAVAERSERPGIDFFPLTVNYQEKYYAAGKIPGGFLKREGRPSEHETLVSRLIDRPIRPLFVSGFKNETQVIATVLSHDMENAPDMVAMVAASAALTLSGVPFLGPIGGARVGYINGDYVLNPVIDDMADSTLDLVVAGTGEAVLMVESEAQELSEEVMLGAVTFGHEGFQPVIDAIIELAEKAARDPWEIETKNEDPYKDRIAELVGDEVRAAYQIAEKMARQEKVAAARKKVMEALLPDGDDGSEAVKIGGSFKKLEQQIVRGCLLKTGRRIDGRDLKTVRPITSEVGLLPRTHGSALFTRGETQAMCVTTLGTGDDEKFIDALEGNYKSNFMLHYNFPPFSVGEVGRMGTPGRREVGHGKLAWRALHPLMPGKDKFPYTVRVVSEITESNGSSSMATVCGSSLAMMDAGVPLARPVAGIAMGLIKEEDEFAVLSDILGDEDHLGDMDFKVAGTVQGVTSLQMDIKIAGITSEIMKVALEQAKDGRMHILGEMGKAIGSARVEMNEYTPRIEVMHINPDRIRDLIGQGGSVIRALQEETGTKLDVTDDGTVKIAAADKKAIAEAKRRVSQIASDPEVGAIYKGTVVKVVDFGAFVNFFGPKDGLVHISQLAPHRVKTVNDVVKEGDQVYVKLLGIDDRGKVRLSMKVVDQETGKEIPMEKAG